MTFQVQPRRALIVYTYSLKQTRQLKKYGALAYVSRKLRYAVLYVNAESLTDVQEQLKKLRFVKRIVASPRSKISDQFGDSPSTGVSAHPLAPDLSEEEL